MSASEEYSSLRTGWSASELDEVESVPPPSHPVCSHLPLNAQIPTLIPQSPPDLPLPFRLRDR